MFILSNINQNNIKVTDKHIKRYYTDDFVCTMYWYKEKYNIKYYYEFILYFAKQYFFK